MLSTQLSMFEQMQILCNFWIFRFTQFSVALVHNCRISLMDSVLTKIIFYSLDKKSSLHWVNLGCWVLYSLHVFFSYILILYLYGLLGFITLQFRHAVALIFGVFWGFYGLFEACRMLPKIWWCFVQCFYIFWDFFHFSFQNLL